MEKENPQQQALNYYCMKLRIKMPSMESIYLHMFPYCRRQIKNASEAKNKGASHFNLTLSY